MPDESFRPLLRRENAVVPRCLVSALAEDVGSTVWRVTSNGAEPFSCIRPKEKPPLNATASYDTIWPDWIPLVTKFLRRLMVGVYGPNWPHAKSLLPLRRCLNRRCRQLQYRCSLSSYEIGEQDDGAVRELECIMMLMGLVEFDLTKPGQTIADFPSKYDAVSLDILFKGEFCPGTKANRHPGIVRARKASRGGPWELRRNQRLRYFGGTGCDRM